MPSWWGCRPRRAWARRPTSRRRDPAGDGRDHQPDHGDEAGIRARRAPARQPPRRRLQRGDPGQRQPTAPLPRAAERPDGPRRRPRRLGPDPGPAPAAARARDGSPPATTPPPRPTRCGSPRWPWRWPTDADADRQGQGQGQGQGEGQGQGQEGQGQGEEGEGAQAARRVPGPGDQGSGDARGRPLAGPAAQLQGQHHAPARPDQRHLDHPRQGDDRQRDGLQPDQRRPQGPEAGRLRLDHDRPLRLLGHRVRLQAGRRATKRPSSRRSPPARPTRTWRSPPTTTS